MPEDVRMLEGVRMSEDVRRPERIPGNLFFRKVFGSILVKKSARSRGLTAFGPYGTIHLPLARRCPNPTIWMRFRCWPLPEQQGEKCRGVSGFHTFQSRPGSPGRRHAEGVRTGGKSVAGWSSLVARWAHNPKVAGSNPAPATKIFDSPSQAIAWLFRFWGIGDTARWTFVPRDSSNRELSDRLRVRAGRAPASGHPLDIPPFGGIRRNPP